MRQLNDTEKLTSQVFYMSVKSKSDFRPNLLESSPNETHLLHVKVAPIVIFHVSIGE